ncbi:MAG: response regulator [Phycisphaeraceae bacterium]|nr:response regulator [Phycisphaeraceae bacterium]MCW5767864.1 response regulator [Phycisphaeraceae bacterium]QYK48120.1 MAG: response regulator [Phycisphaeraceae bacterium]
MPAAAHILVVDDESDLVDLVSYNLKKSGYETSIATDGRQALQQVAKVHPDLVILDVMMPGLSGTEVLTRLRSEAATAKLPVIMLTAKSEEVDQVVGLTVGADDYVTKPFSVKVLMARVESLLRRSRGPTQDRQTLEIQGVQLDLGTHEATVDGEPVKLTVTEFRLLVSLLQANGRVLSRSALMARAMGPGITVTERTIDVHVTAIRKKLGRWSHLVKTVRGVGYRIADEPDEGDE